MIAAKTLAKKLAEALYDRKGESIELLDVKKVSDVCHYLLLCSAKNKFHLDALKDAVEETLAEKKVPMLGSDGRPDSGWMVVDTGRLLIHIFVADKRRYYELEKLWSDGKPVELELE